MDSPPAAVCLFPVSSEPAPACDGTNLALNSLYEPPRDPAGCCRIQTLGPEAEMKEEKRAACLADTRTLSLPLQSSSPAVCARSSVRESAAPSPPLRTATLPWFTAEQSRPCAAGLQHGTPRGLTGSFKEGSIPPLIPLPPKLRKLLLKESSAEFPCLILPSTL
ncbi:UNVERIFIED_CONTAM: hypothetical protein FKN15_030907 [Acipenser sinensis]